MNKRQQEEQRRQEDQALKQGLLWAAGAVVLEVLLFLVNRYAFDFEASAQGVALAENLRVVLSALRVVGLAAFVAGGVLLDRQVKKKGKIGFGAVICAVGAVVLVCAHVAVKYQSGGMRMLYLLIPVLGGLALSYYIYQKEFFLAALSGILAMLGLWFVRVGGMGAEVLATMLLCVWLGRLVMVLKANDGLIKRKDKELLRLLPEKANYTVMLASGAAALAVQLLAMFAGGAVAYYLIFAMGAWLFAMLVYYTVKML